MLKSEAKGEPFIEYKLNSPSGTNLLPTRCFHDMLIIQITDWMNLALLWCDVNIMMVPAVWVQHR